MFEREERERPTEWHLPRAGREAESVLQDCTGLPRGTSLRREEERGGGGGGSCLL